MRRQDKLMCIDDKILSVEQGCARECCLQLCWFVSLIGTWPPLEHRKRLPTTTSRDNNYFPAHFRRIWAHAIAVGSLRLR
jgi:hypothetical protein